MVMNDRRGSGSLSGAAGSASGEVEGVARHWVGAQRKRAARCCGSAVGRGRARAQAVTPTSNETVCRRGTTAMAPRSAGVRDVVSPGRAGCTARRQVAGRPHGHRLEPDRAPSLVGDQRELGVAAELAADGDGVRRTAGRAVGVGVADLAVRRRPPGRARPARAGARRGPGRCSRGPAPYGRGWRRGPSAWRSGRRRRRAGTRRRRCGRAPRRS